ncbi:tetratricopeptide repeat protein [Sansalvadorimonas sp. 2012CJ34-2]|uniref:Tetratricopeptide repeat protein n=1 Tax=Parendozoicomonas callyspongiae TaxID=2942213 RepID=A0ABT0PIB2_9GAMM|nr:tetratricopeptide repeat protein [Sansalvadorimonas sp. 2012CJ34-2]MCL6271113.1 tetratricopeptide repeat protein [Sansalvadorimonas sp. 2012CJ34-2]
MSALRDVLGALGGDHHLLGKLQDGVSIGQFKHVDQDLLESIYALAFNLYQAGDYEKARQVFLYLSFHDHTDARFLSGFGASCFRTGNLEQAGMVLKSAVEMDALDPGPALNLAHTYDALGQPEQARDALLQVMARSAKSSEYKPLAQIASNMMDRLAPPAGE